MSRFRSAMMLAGVLTVVGIFGSQEARRERTGAGAGDAAPQFEIIGRTRTNNREQLVDVPVAPQAAHVSQITVRAGSLSIVLEAVEIEYADGSLSRHVSGERLAAGWQSRRMAVDPARAVRRITVVKRPGLRDGYTELQVLGVPAKPGR